MRVLRVIQLLDIPLPDFNSIFNFKSRILNEKSTDIFDRGWWVCTRDSGEYWRYYVTLPECWIRSNTLETQILPCVPRSREIRLRFEIRVRFIHSIIILAFRSSIPVTVNNCMNNPPNVGNTRIEMSIDCESSSLNGIIEKIRIYFPRDIWIFITLNG